MEYIQKQVEALIFSSNEPLDIAEIKGVLDENFQTEIPEEDVIYAVEAAIAKYQADDFPFEIIKISNGYRFYSKPVFHNLIGTHLKQITNKQLSRTALETLAIIAYKQPVEKSEIEAIRGVNSDYSVQKLLERELIEIVGRSDGPGKPLVYGTSKKFMEYFGINTVDDLPKLKDFKVADHEIGEPAPIEDITQSYNGEKAQQADSEDN